MDLIIFKFMLPSCQVRIMSRGGLLTSGYKSGHERSSSSSSITTARLHQRFNYCRAHAYVRMYVVCVLSHTVVTTSAI